MEAPDLNTVAAVDDEVRFRIKYKVDTGGLGGWRDVWSLPEDTLKRGSGDCEDHMILAASLLQDRGVSPSYLYFTIVSTDGTRASGDHAILCVSVKDVGLTTCADTYITRPRPLMEAYRDDQVVKWMRLSEPGRWRYWRHS